VRGAVVSIQVAILMAVILAIALAVAGYLMTTFQSAARYTYIAVLQAYVYPGGGGSWMKLCVAVGGSDALKIEGVELGGVKASRVEVYVGGSPRAVVRAGETAVVKAFFDMRVEYGQSLVGWLYTAEGFKFPFTPTYTAGEPKCPFE